MYVIMVPMIMQIIIKYRNTSYILHSFLNYTKFSSFIPLHPNIRTRFSFHTSVEVLYVDVVVLAVCGLLIISKNDLLIHSIRY